MTNRDRIETIKICDGEDIILERDLSQYKSILDSDINVVSYLIKMKKLGVRYKDRWDIVDCLFRDFDDKEKLKIAIENIIKITNSYKRHLNRDDFDNAISLMNTRLTFCTKFKNDLENLKKLKLVFNCNYIRLSIDDNDSVGSIFNIKHQEKTDDYRTLFLYNWEYSVYDVGCIVLKGDDYEIIKVHNKKENEDMKENILRKFNYDLAIVNELIS